MAADIHQEFETIIKKKKVDPIFPFLKELLHKERRALVPTIKKLDKYYSEFVQQGQTWSSRGAQEQHQMLNIANFVCLTGVEFTKSGSYWLDSDYVKRIFEFYIPDWFGKHVNAHAIKEGHAPFRIDYEWMMELKDQKLLDPSDTLIIELLPHFLYDTHPIKNTHQVTSVRNDSKLLRFPETLTEHIWLFFKEESTIHWTDHYMNYNVDKKDLLSWKQTFKYYADNGTIDRFRLLKESLATTNMNFNKPSTSWFIDLFDMLAPNTDEMLKLQGNMMGVFNCPHSKPTNVILKNFKKLCIEKGFLTDEFLENTPILLSSETKATVTSTLMILDKLAKKQPKKANEICHFATQALLSNDSAIQTRTAKIIAKYGKPTDENLINEIGTYKDVLLTEANVLLSPFIAEHTVTFEDATEFHRPQDKIDILSNENEVTIPNTIDDLMFLASQVFDHNDELHFEIFPAALVNLNNELTAENVDRFEPALQRAYKHVMGDWRAGIGKLDHMLCVFFIDYTNALIERYPNGAIKLKKIRDVFQKKEKENLKQFHNQGRHLYSFRDWYDSSDSRIYKPFYEKLLFVLKELKFQNNLPILATPTHKPHWIDPKILIDRIKKWQDKKMPLGHIDLQFAMSRTHLEGGDKLIKKITASLIDEPQRLLCFLLDKNAKPQGPFNTIAHWWTAAITKNPETVYREFHKFVYTSDARSKYTGDYTWRVGKTAFSNSKWDYAKNKTVSFTDYRKMLKIDLYPKSEDLKLIKSIFNFKFSPKLGQKTMLYGELFFKGEWYETSENDVKRFYSMVPNNPENLLARINDKTLKYPEFWGETSKRMLIKTIEQLLTHQLPFGDMAHLMTAGGLMCSDKTARSLTSELWMYGVSNNLIDNTKIGTYIGKHFEVEFAPLKRFTDLVIESMTRISTKHDSQLLIMIENMLIQMSETPIRGLNKLLEIYLELNRKNNKKPSPLLKDNLRSWTSSKSLIKILKTIES